MDLNVVAVAICIREASKSMRRHNVRGHIINLNSLAGHDAAGIKVPLSLYCASKYAVTGLTKSVRNELASLNAGIKITVSFSNYYAQFIFVIVYGVSNRYG